MPKYQVEINGQNFLLEVDGRVAKQGFFPTRFVEAANLSAVENSAAGMIRETQLLRDLARNIRSLESILDERARRLGT